MMRMTIYADKVELEFELSGAVRYFFLGTIWWIFW